MSSETNHSYRKYSARTFSRAELVCPRCEGKLEKRVAACPRCRFDYATCERAFPFAPPPLSLVIDPGRQLPVGIEGDVQGAYEKLRKRFPQVDLSFCFVHLPEHAAVQEFAFWLHNSAPEAGEARSWAILVVGDLSSGRLALTVGYALEPFIKPEPWEAALQELAASIADGQWQEGLGGFLLEARDLLTAAWGSAEQRRKASQRKSGARKQLSQPEAAGPADQTPPAAGEPPEDRAAAVPRVEHPHVRELGVTLPPVPRTEPKAREDAVTSR